jgi:hypothetical protein
MLKSNANIPLSELSSTCGYSGFAELAYGQRQRSDFTLHTKAML